MKALEDGGMEPTVEAAIHAAAKRAAELST